jgi:signal peptidase I
MTDGESSRGRVAVDGWPAGPESDDRWRRRVVVIVVVGVATLSVGVLIGLLVRAGSDAGRSSSDSYAMAGTSMEPTLRHGDPVTAQELDDDEIDRGDVVVLEAPTAAGSDSILIIKRVVAVAGDEIATTPDGSEVLISGEPTNEPYLAPGTTTSHLVTQEVPAGHVFVMGDNRPNSLDSRVFGPVPYQDIVAMVEAT